MCGRLHVHDAGPGGHGVPGHPYGTGRQRGQPGPHADGVGGQRSPGADPHGPGHQSHRQAVLHAHVLLQPGVTGPAAPARDTRRAMVRAPRPILRGQQMAGAGVGGGREWVGIRGWKGRGVRTVTWTQRG